MRVPDDKLPSLSRLNMKIDTISPEPIVGSENNECSIAISEGRDPFLPESMEASTADCSSSITDANIGSDNVDGSVPKESRDISKTAIIEVDDGSHHTPSLSHLAGTPVMVVSMGAKYLSAATMISSKGSDASGVHDEEPAADEIE